METRYVEKINGCYFANVDITPDEWCSLLADDKIFTKENLDMIISWYEQVDHQATTSEILQIKKLKHTPFNGYVIGLGKKIIKKLNRFELVYKNDGKTPYLKRNNNKKCYFLIPFEGWHKNFDDEKDFVWKVRKELVIALEKMKLVSPKNFKEDFLESVVDSGKEGKKTAYYTTKYERNSRNRDAAIQIHGLKCQICGFDFEEIYGEIGRNFIEVHHKKPLYSIDEEIQINPEKDLICVCSNCHRMLHRRKYEIITPERLIEMMMNEKQVR